MIRKAITMISLVLLAGACSMNSDDTAEQQLKKKKEELTRLNEEISELENELAQTPEKKIGFRVPVSVKDVQPEVFNHYVDITGKLEAEEDAYISPEMNGQIEKIYIREGSVVKEGQLLVSLNTSLIESNIREVETGLELAGKLYEKQKDLWDQQIGSELQYLEAKNAREQAEARLATLKAQLDMARVKAPFSGVVETIMKKEGELAAPGMQLLQLINLSKLKMYGDISERYLTSVKKGENVRITFPDIDNYTIEASVHRVGNTIDNASRTFRIEVKINNPDGKLKPNMYSILRLNDYSSPDALVVPSFVIKQDIKGNYLYVADTENNKAIKRYVSTGLSYEDKSEITDGISNGDKVIIRGFSQVSDGIDIDLR